MLFIPDSIYILILMKDTNYAQQYTLSRVINALRSALLNRGFFEHHLYSTIDYKIENTDTFKVKDQLYLRYNPEPDIWQVGDKHNKFFWIGSMFRNEKKLSKVHRYEFTVLDIYLKQGTMKILIETFLSLLRDLEKTLRLPILSDKEVRYISYDEFHNSKKKFKGNFWLVLTDYPTYESFYDTPGKDRNHSNKFEIFYMKNGVPLEIAACGELGENLNKINYIKGAKKLLNKKIADKKFIGFGFGLERLAHLYNLL
jgi:aspartyl/asparaginyl-tRNA synthetase